MFCTFSTVSYKHFLNILFSSIMFCCFINYSFIIIKRHLLFAANNAESSHRIREKVSMFFSCCSCMKDVFSRTLC